MSSAANDYIAGAIGGAAGLIVGHPFDTTKVQLQTQQTCTPYKTTWEAVKVISRQGMTRGFFRGMAFPVASYGVVNSVFFGVYGNTLNFLKGEQERKSTYPEIYAAGCAAGFAQLFVACPVDVVKVVLQSQIPKSANPKGQYFTGPIECTRWILRCHGITGLYKGFGTMFWRDIPTFGVYTLVYESLYDLLIKHGYSDSHGIVGNLLAGGIAGVVCWAPIMPFDNVKSLLQSDTSHRIYKGFWDCAKQLYKSRGVRGFYTGLWMVSLRAFTVNAVTFLGYAKTLDYLNGRVKGFTK